jgi:4-aminobutyrate aminotransferase-like enzyme
MKRFAILAVLALGACSTNATTGKKYIDMNKVVAVLQTGCGHQVEYAAALQAAAEAVKVSQNTSTVITDASSVIAIGCLLVPAAAVPAAPANPAAVVPSDG